MSRYVKLHGLTDVTCCEPQSATKVLAVLSCSLKTRATLQRESLARRHQIGVLQRSTKKRLELHNSDRVFWNWALAGMDGVALCPVVIVKPDSVIAWHRKAFRMFWTWKVRRGRPGRLATSPEIRTLIRA